MRMIHVPQGLKKSVAALALCIPLVALEVILIKRAPWWHLPYAKMGMACLPVFILYLGMAWSFLKGNKNALYVAAVAGAFWFITSGWISFRLHNTSLGLFTLILGALLSCGLAWIHLELSRSFVDPRIHWYEGLPKPIPNLQCEVVAETEKNTYRVTRLDREGVFVYRDNSIQQEKIEEFSKIDKKELLLSFRDRQVRCTGVPIRILNRMGPVSGIGFQFSEMHPDARKTLGDFVEVLKGEGYVS